MQTALSDFLTALAWTFTRRQRTPRPPRRTMVIEEVPVRVFDHAAGVPDKPDLVLQRFRDTPLRWLPLAAGLHGTSEFDGRVTVLGVPVATRFTIGSPWEDQTLTSRRVQMVVGGSAGGPAPLAELEGDLSVSVVGSGARVRYHGSGIAMGHGPRRGWGQLVIPLIARATVIAVARRLGAYG